MALERIIYRIMRVGAFLLNQRLSTYPRVGMYWDALPYYDPSGNSILIGNSVAVAMSSKTVGHRQCRSAIGLYWWGGATLDPK